LGDDFLAIFPSIVLPSYKRYSNTSILSDSFNMLTMNAELEMLTY
jgi:hypothetical protein